MRSLLSFENVEKGNRHGVARSSDQEYSGASKVNVFILGTRNPTFSNVLGCPAMANLPRLLGNDSALEQNMDPCCKVGGMPREAVRPRECYRLGSADVRRAARRARAAAFVMISSSTGPRSPAREFMARRAGTRCMLRPARRAAGPP